MTTPDLPEEMLSPAGEIVNPGLTASAGQESLFPADPVLRERFEILWNVLPENWQRFVECCWREPGKSVDGTLAIHLAPAAKAGRHHGYIGGLFEHTLEVAEIGLQLAQMPVNNGEVRAEIVVAGALVHDLGKTWTYSWADAAGCRRSPLGRQFSHIVVGLYLVQQVIEKLGETRYGLGIEEVDIAHIKHIIKTHHGVPNPPKTIEGLAVQLGDSASAGMAIMRQLKGQQGQAIVGGGLGLSSLWGRIRNNRPRMRGIRPRKRPVGEDS